MTKTRIAVAGAGYIGQAHMGVTAASPSCMLSAIVDPSPAAVEIAARAGVPLYKSLDELFEKDRPDGVVLATPNQLHVEHALHRDQVVARSTVAVHQHHERARAAAFAIDTAHHTHVQARQPQISCVLARLHSHLVRLSFGSR